MEDLFLHVFVVAPCIKWLTSKDRPWNRKSVYPGVTLAIAALAFIAVNQLQREEMNLYEHFGLTPSATKGEVSAAYRRLAVKYHPDKNPEPEAKQQFDKIRELHEVLSNGKKRETYCRFGDFSTTGEIDKSHFWDVLFVAVIMAAIPVFFGHLYTFRKDSQTARKIFMAYVAMTFCLEMLLRFGNDTELNLWWVPGFGSMVPFEKVKALQGLIPIVLNGVLLLCSELHTDTEALIEQLAIFTLQTHLDLVDRADKVVCQAEASYGLKKLATEGKEEEPNGKDREGGDTQKKTENYEEDTSDDDRENEADWWKAVQQRDISLKSPPLSGFDVASFVESLKEGKKKDWLKTRGKQLTAFIQVRKNASDSSSGMTLASAFFFLIIVLKYYWFVSSGEPETPEVTVENNPA
eukprot:GHVQ01024441.1.p1 GENE.GHVQ01024441.1~~GHVQ01024441.1.p1  ORF type:complete len:407 (-),score=63.31 GHVQ01024441.1:1817-3037(-)